MTLSYLQEASLLSGLYALPEVLTSNRFYVDLLVDASGLVDAFFTECSGFKRSYDVIEVAEVTAQKWGADGTNYGRVVRTKIPGNTKSENITLKRGLTLTTTLWDWFATIEQGQWSEQFRDGAIVIYNQWGSEMARYTFTGGWPVSYTIGSLNANTNDFVIEELELAVDEFYRDAVSSEYEAEASDYSYKAAQFFSM
ncbi:MAG: phage tail protein [Cyanobacteria bacterium P01_E01_bin.42]